MSRRVLVTDVAWPDTLVEEAILAEAGFELVVSPDDSESTLCRLAADVHGVITCFASVTRRVIEAAPHLRVIARTGVGLDNIDVTAAAERDIAVTRVPDYCVDEVSEHAVALALMLMRGIPQYAETVRRGEWGVRPELPLHRIRGSRAMVLGRGLIGDAVAQKLAGLGLEVVETPDGADLLSIHVPLTEHTRHFVDAEYIGRLAPGAVIVNTARGAVVDLDAALTALDEKRVAGLGLDVFPREPLPGDSPLLDRSDVVVTPHVAFYSEESLTELRTRAAQSVVDVLKGPAA